MAAWRRFRWRPARPSSFGELQIEAVGCVGDRCVSRGGNRRRPGGRSCRASTPGPTDRRNESRPSERCGDCASRSTARRSARIGFRRSAAGDAAGDADSASEMSTSAAPRVAQGVDWVTTLTFFWRRGGSVFGLAFGGQCGGALAKCGGLFGESLRFGRLLGRRRVADRRGSAELRSAAIGGVDICRSGGRDHRQQHEYPTESDVHVHRSS